MAKFNPILGTASGKLGDIVLYRANGAQLSRVRVRSVKNPKTQAQALQRMVFATASAARTALGAIIDHSFQSVKYGQKSVQYFMKRAVDDLRVSALSCLELTPYEQVSVANFNVKGVSAMACNSLLISQGSLKPFEIVPFGTGTPNLSIDPCPVVEIGDDNAPQVYLGDFIRALGLKDGQQVTFVRLRVLNDQAALYGEYPGTGAIDENSLFNWQFSSVVDIFRFRIDPNITDAQRTALMPTNGQHLVIENGNGIICDSPFELLYQLDQDEENIIAIRPTSDYEKSAGASNFSALAAIRSELVNGQWQRSTQRLVFFPADRKADVSGASMYAALPTYMNGVSVTDSDKLLNYEDLESYDSEGHAPGGVTPGTGGVAEGSLVCLHDLNTDIDYLGTVVGDNEYEALAEHVEGGADKYLVFKQSFVGKLLKNISFKPTTTTEPSGSVGEDTDLANYDDYVVTSTVINIE